MPPAGRSQRFRRTAGLGRWTVLLGAVALVLGCATGASMRAGRDAELRRDYDGAVVEYTKVVKNDPDNRDAQNSLQRAKLRSAQEHYGRARRMASLGRYDTALVEFQLASEMNPASGDIESGLRETRQKLRTKLAVEREGKTELESLVDQARQQPSPGLDLPRDVSVPESFVTARDANSRDVFKALAAFGDINIVFDPAFRDSPVSVDLRKSTFEDALTSLAASTRNFYRVTAPRTVTIIPDTPAKRREYEEEVVRTFYLSNADLKETIDLLRIVIDARRIAPVSATNAISIKDTPERIAAAGRLITAIDKARAELVIDVELLEVDRTRLLEFGLQVASPPAQGSPTGIDGVVDVNRDNLTLRDLTNLTQSDIFISNVPSLFYRLLKSDANTRTLANPHLRTSEGLAAQARFGERVPVPVTTFAPIATGGVAQQPITSFNYEDIGVNIDITPRTHHNDDVSLALKVEITNISGTGFGGLPTFGNRSISTTIRLRDGETNLLAGLIRDEERDVLAGVPGLIDLPLIGRLFAHNRKENHETDIVLTITPHIVRVLDLTEADLRPFKVGRDSSQPLLEFPTLGQPPIAPMPQPGTPPPPVRPVFPALPSEQPIRPPDTTPEPPAGEKPPQ